MPKIVDKEQKRFEIASKSKDLLIEKGIAKLTVSEVAKNAGVGKGTIYQYFSSKDDIVFAIIDAYIEEELALLDSDLKALDSFEDKIYRYFDFILQSEKEDRKKELKGYLEYLSIAIVSSDEKMQIFNTECRKKFQVRLESIIDEAIKKGQINPIAKDLILGLYATEKGFVIISGTEKESRIDIEMKNFLDSLIEIIKIK